MPITINARGTSISTFQIGKGGTTFRPATSDPGGSNGDFWFDTTLGELKVRLGGAYELIRFGNLRLATNTISSANSNGDIILDPNGTGLIQLSAVTKLTGNASTPGALFWIASSDAGQSAVAQTSPGLRLTAVDMTTTNKYTPGILFGSTDTSFTTTNPKWSAGIFGYATENFAADTDAGMGIEFFGLADNAGATPTPTSLGTWTVASGLTLVTDLAVAEGGTGRSTATAYGLLAGGTTSTAAHQSIAVGLTTEILVGGGAATLPVWTTATGTGAPVRAGSPTFTGTPIFPANVVTLANLAQISTARFLGRVTASTGDVESLTGTQATTLLDVFTSGLKGLAPASGGGSTTWLRADGTWTTIALATAASTSTIADDTTTNATMYPVWVTANTGNLALKVTSTKLSYNPSTGTLTMIPGVNKGIIVSASGRAGFQLVDSSAATVSPWYEALGDRNTADTSMAFAGYYVAAADRTDAEIPTGKFLGGMAFGGTITPGDRDSLRVAASISAWADGAWPVGGATTPMGLRIYVGETPQTLGTTGVTYGSILAMEINKSGNIGIGTAHGDDQVMRIGKDITGGTTAYGARLISETQSDVTTSSIGFSTALPTVAAAFTLSQLTHYQAAGNTIGAGSTVTAQYGFLVAANMTGGTTNIGFLGNLAEATNVWNFYAQGTAHNFFSGDVRLGSISDVNTKLLIAGNSTGATARSGVRLTQTAQSDVTSSYYGFYSLPATQATAFTCATMAGFVASQGTLGAGSTITSMIGFLGADNTNGTNNYGFYGSMSSGAAKWNLYMTGSAKNYLAGNLLIGSSTDSGEKLQVTGSSLVTEVMQIGGQPGATSVSLTVGDPTSGYSGTSCKGIQSRANITSGITNDYIAVYVSLTTANVSFTTLDMYGMRVANPNKGAAHTITYNTGVMVDDLTAGTNNYAFRAGITAGAAKWSFYADGGAKSYHSGNFQIGSATDTGQKLQVTGTSIFSSTVTLTVAPVFTDQSGSRTALGLGNVENTALSTWAGSTNLITLGTITTGTWNGTDIAFANLAQISTARILGRVTAATGDIESLTGTQATTLLDVFTSGLKGLAPSSGGGTTTWLRADGTWTTIALATAASTATIADDTTTNATMYPVWVTANTGNLALKVTSTKLSYNPSTGTMTMTPGANNGLVIYSAGRGAIQLHDSSAATVASWYEVIGDRNTSSTDMAYGGWYVAAADRTDAEIPNAKQLGGIAFGGCITPNDKTSLRVSASIAAFADGAWPVGGATAPIGLRFYVGDTPQTLGTTGVTYGAINALEINKSGNIGIGTAHGDDQVMRIGKDITGGTTAYGARLISETQSDVTTASIGFSTALTTQATSFTLSQLIHYQAAGGTIGAGSTVTTQYGFLVASNMTGGTTNIGFLGNLASASNVWNFYAQGTAANFMSGDLRLGVITDLNAKFSISGNFTGAVTSYAIRIAGTAQSDVTTSFYAMAVAPSTQATTFTLTNMYGYSATDGTKGAGSTITNNYGFFCSSLANGTNNYGLYLNVADAATSWNVYANGTANNYMAAELRVGSTTNGNSAIVVGGSTIITGGVSRQAYRNQATAQSDVTSTFYGFYSVGSTQATTFTLTTMAGFVAADGTKGAGSTITNNIGFIASGLTNGGTLNAGFQGSLPAAATTYNLYMSGSAKNYLLGTLMVGSSTDTGEKLQVTGTSIFSSTATFSVSPIAPTATAGTNSTAVATTAYSDAGTRRTRNYTHGRC